MNTSKKYQRDNTKIAIAVFDKCASEYQDKFMNVDLYSDSLSMFCGSIAKENARILEIACGPGNITKYLLEKRPGFKILGIDLSPNMLALAKANNPSAEFQLMDCRDISRLREKYDAVMCGFCLPYLSKEEAVKLIHDASELLNPNGVFYVSTMEDDNSKSGLKTAGSGDQVYVNYHEAGYLVHALRECGFKITDLQRKDYPANDETKVVDLVILAGK